MPKSKSKSRSNSHSKSSSKSQKPKPTNSKQFQNNSNTPITLKFLHLYPNMMDLYGDSGNLQILKYRAEKRGVNVEIYRLTIGEKCPLRIYASPGVSDRPTEESFPYPVDLTDYDLIFLGGGSDKEQNLVATDILKYKKVIPKAYKSGVFFLTICGGYQLFGKYYKDAENNMIEGLGLFDFRTESSTDKSQRCIGNIVIEAMIHGHPVQVIGFENHGGQTRGVVTPLGRVLAGNGNIFNGRSEGILTDNFIGTYLHGPLLSKNPALADYILKYCMKRHTREHVSLQPLDDRFENTARQEMLDKLLF